MKISVENIGLSYDEKQILKNVSTMRRIKSLLA